MSDPVKIRRALISVYDKTGIVDFARALHDEFGIEIISTGGTAKTLTEAGIPLTLVENVTGFPEMMDGRVKTLHPKIHAAILADRDNPEHMRQLKEQGIEPIDMVVVNLYPFEETIAKPDCTFEEAIEMIDIGGPCLLRAAAKNYKHVLVVTWPWSYDSVLRNLRTGPSIGAVTDEKRGDAAFHAFDATSRYDAAVWQWLGGEGLDGMPTWLAWQFFAEAALRYGENPDQIGRLLTRADQTFLPNLAEAVIAGPDEYQHDAA
ncbi:MAG: bifunctional phosphoribosylaminoimidazolecarboxamide formyltransferase/IMP cyclohydrolase, partial [Planctomycetes bacterium]|nr:bifunctional phosphoribosylaminoimidazolecarboxamide formyltransferase/IMP cyclohydrolase [Planctomycetota bacterium]